MNGIFLWLPITLVALVVGFGVGFYIKKVMMTRTIEDAAGTNPTHIG